MNGRQRFEKAIAFQETDRPPHFEEIFDLTQEAFGRPFPGGDALAKATPAEVDRLLHECVEIYALIVERFQWDALCIWHPWSGPQLLQCLRIAKQALGGRIMVGAYIGGSIHAIDTTRDFDQFSVDLFEHPEVIHAQAKAMSDEAITWGRALREAAVKVAVIPDARFGG